MLGALQNHRWEGFVVELVDPDHGYNIWVPQLPMRDYFTYYNLAQSCHYHESHCNKSIERTFFT